MIDFNDGTDSDRQEALLTVNGSHYMTIGHVIDGSLYPNMRPMSRIIF
jgi:hypothetical protein